MSERMRELDRPILRLVSRGLFASLMLAAPSVLSQVPHGGDSLDGDGLEFRNVSLGGVLTAGIDASDVGDALLGELGAESIGIRSFGVRSWLIQWDALLAARAGVDANTHPFLPVAGAHERGNVEAGSRFLPLEAWSPYVGLGLDTDLAVLTYPGVPIGNLWRYNNADGVAGLTVNGAVRVAVGASLLTARHSVLLEAFFHEALRAPEVNAPGVAFAEGGLSVRWDISQSLTLRVAGFIGRTPAVLHAGLDYTVLTTHEELDADFRKIFGNGMWLGAQVQSWQELYSTTYAMGHSYPSSDTPTFIFMLVYGVPFGRQG